MKGASGGRLRRRVRRLTRNEVLRGAARSGYVASALLRVLIGVLALALAARIAGARPDASGAFALIRGVPGGTVLLALVAAGNVALAAWLIVLGALQTQPRRLERWRQRSIHWGRSAVYVIVGSTAARIAFGAREDSSRNERDFGRILLDLPGGAVALGLIGGLVAVIGASMMWIGLWRRFERTVHLPDDAGARRTVVVLGVVGYVLQGASILLVGVFVVIGAFTLDPRRAAGLGGTLASFADEPLGRVLLVAIGVGWIVAGAYAGIRAHIARLD